MARTGILDWADGRAKTIIEQAEERAALILRDAEAEAMRVRAGAGATQIRQDANNDEQVPWISGRVVASNIVAAGRALWRPDSTPCLPDAGLIRDP